MSRLKPLVVVYADESCLGNGRDGATPGGAASLVEIRHKDTVIRRDIFISSPDTTNNQMALSGAIATFALLSQKGRRFRVAYYSDSEYLVKGMTEWVAQWQARGWRRKGGKVLNLELWRKLVEATAGHEPGWIWVRGHAGNVKNEYVNDLAIRAASEQIHSSGFQESDFHDWLRRRRARGQFVDYDPDEEFAAVEAELGARA